MFNVLKMNRLKTWSVLLSALVVVSLFFLRAARPVDAVKWYSWQEAVALCKTAPRPIMVDTYTGWCGYCKKMDANTFSDAGIAGYLNANFYAVKFDAEMKDSFEFNNHVFKYLPEYKTHELAVALLDGQLSYPTLVYLTGTFERIAISPGYKLPADLMPELEFVKTGAYSTMSMEQFLASKGK